MTDKLTPAALHSAHPGKSYFFFRTYIERAASMVEDEAIYEAALALHQLSAADAQALFEASEIVASLVFDDTGVCTQAYYHPGDVEERSGDQLRYRFEGHKQFGFSADAPTATAWMPDPDGKSVLGGLPPEGFIYPDHKHPLNFQYLGFLSNEDLPAPVAGDGIHLVFPLLHYDDPYKVFDISDPMAPKALVRDDCTIVENSRVQKAYCTSGASENPGYDGYAAYQDGDTLHYEPRRVSRQTYDVQMRDVAPASFPRWIQYPQIPICPNTGEAMTFLGQFGDGTPAIENDFVRRTRELNKYGAASALKFIYGAGRYGIFAFYHPQGQTMAILLQD